MNIYVKVTCTISHLRPFLKVFLEIFLGVIIGNHDTQKPLDTREAKPTKNLSAKNSFGKRTEFILKIFWPGIRLFCFNFCSYKKSLCSAD